MSKPRKKKKSPKRVLALPDLEQAKSAVLNSLTSVSGQRTYDHAINDFVEWYCFSHETYRLWTSSGTQDERTDSTPWRRRAGVPDDVLMRRACLAKDPNVSDLDRKLWRFRWWHPNQERFPRPGSCSMDRHKRPSTACPHLLRLVFLDCRAREPPKSAQTDGGVIPSGDGGCPTSSAAMALAYAARMRQNRKT